MPTHRWGLSAVSWKEKIVAIGGRRGAGKGKLQNQSVVEAYDPSTDTWEPLPNLITARGGHAAAVVDNTIHVFGGSVNDLGSQPISRHEIFDGSRWESSDIQLTPRKGLESAVIGRRIFAIGGSTQAGWWPVKATNLVEQLDCDSN